MAYRKNHSAESASDIYQTVTDKIVAALESASGGKFVCPWNRGGITMPESVAGRPYRGMNTLLLWLSAEERGYNSPIWGTYKAFTEKGAQVRKGEKATHVLFWKSIKKENKDDPTKTDTFLFARAYAVFNADQVDDYKHKTGNAALPESERDATAEEFFSEVPANVIHGGNRAFYSMKDDSIHLPAFADFHSAGSYYATRAHETVHWSGAESRLNREFGKRFGDEAYSFEELVAELGAAFLCATLGLENEPREDHASYLAHWLKVLKADKHAIFTAASQAQKAVDFIIGQTEGTEEDSELLAA